MKARIQWAGEAMFLGESGSGHVVVMDGPLKTAGAISVFVRWRCSCWASVAAAISMW